MLPPSARFADPPHMPCTNPLGLTWDQAVEAISSVLQNVPPASVDAIATQYKTPFHILLSTILSLRTRDSVTLAASERLFERVDSVYSIATMSADEIAALIYPVGFYAVKAERIKQICTILIEQYGGEVPNTREALLELPGVGLKTTNLVLSAGFSIPAICVDIHVHRIANRLGFVKTKSPDDTEARLQQTLPKKFWLTINQALVRFGQRVCKPRVPLCSHCPLKLRCPSSRELQTEQ